MKIPRFSAVATAVATTALSVVSAPAATALPDDTRAPSAPSGVLSTTGLFVTGDWNGDGTDTAGWFDFDTGVWRLRNANTSGGADLVFAYGNPGEVGWPVVGDWDNDGDDTPGLLRDNRWLLRNANTSGTADLDFFYGNINEDGFPVVGDWDDDGDDTVGLVRVNNWLLRNTNSTGAADLNFSYGVGIPGHWPVPGDWNADGGDSPGVAEPRTTTFAWFLRNLNTTGPGEISFTFI